MRTSVVLLLLGVAISMADDRSFCEGECTKKYKEEVTKTACSSGCLHRGSISDGSRGFVVCHAACAAGHNETDTEERRACDFACSLPVTNIVMMKVDYGTGDEAPRVQVVRKEGGDILGSDIGMGPDFDQFILRPHSLLGSEEDSKDSKESEKSEDRIPESMLQSMFKMKTGDREFDRMQERLDKLVKSFFDRSHMASRIASERPSGHDDVASSLGSTVDNEDDNGHQILFVAPLEGEEIADLKNFERSHQPSIRDRLPAFFQGAICFILLIAIFCVLVVLIMRQYRNYVIYRNQSQSSRGMGDFIRLQGAMAQAELQMEFEENQRLEKKIPIDDEEESYPAPAGLAPPAYDQLSVHSKKTEQ